MLKIKLCRYIVFVLLLIKVHKLLIAEMTGYGYSSLLSLWERNKLFLLLLQKIGLYGIMVKMSFHCCAWERRRSGLISNGGIILGLTLFSLTLWSNRNEREKKEILEGKTTYDSHCCEKAADPAWDFWSLSLERPSIPKNVTDDICGVLLLASRWPRAL